MAAEDRGTGRRSERDYRDAASCGEGDTDPNPPVMRQLVQLDKALAVLEESLEGLTAQLNPVLTPERPEPAVDRPSNPDDRKEPEPRRDSPIAERLASATSMVQRLTRRIHAVGPRIEI